MDFSELQKFGQEMAQSGYERGYLRAISEALTLLTNRNDIEVGVRMDLYAELAKMQPGNKDRAVL